MAYGKVVGCIRVYELWGAEPEMGGAVSRMWEVEYARRNDVSIGEGTKVPILAEQGSELWGSEAAKFGRGGRKHWQADGDGDRGARPSARRGSGGRRSLLDGRGAGDRKEYFIDSASIAYESCNNQ